VRIEIYWEFYHGIIYIANEDILLELLWNVVKAIIQLTITPPTNGKVIDTQTQASF
jgi:hypothetical protein